MKSMLAHHELGGPVNEWEARRAARVDDVSDKSLGTLVKRLFESYVVVKGFEPPVAGDAAIPVDQVSIAFQFRIEMAEQDRLSVKTAIEELVLMRNELVHHLIEKFDVWTNDGCVAATEHLNQCYERIDRHVVELQEWAKNMDETRATAASLVQSAAFKDFMFNGIAPDGAVDWQQAGIVRALRDAKQTLSVNGWVRLEDARIWIAEHHPEQVPEKYGCRTWPHVLSESRAFRMEYRHGADGRQMAWYCERSR